jgi:TPR repeat protein
VGGGAPRARFAILRSRRAGCACARPLKLIVRRQMRPRLQRAACALATSLLCGAGATPLDDACDAAYWDGTKLQDLSTCISAAEAGNAEAEFQYGLILWSGHDRESEPKAAIDWLRKSARQGHRLAQISLGAFMSHEEMPREVRNLVEAYAWFVTAGDTQAAERVKARLTNSQTQEAKQLGMEFRAKYATK